MTQEELRLRAVREKGTPWKRWGPYLSERQWGTVREDYSEHGAAWDYFTHDQARSRTYRWGEDGIAGLCDDQQLLCFGLAFWNGADPILKERLFGLTNREGNHGEDCKEYYFYLDATPTYSYLKFLYKYPQRAYPYEELVRTARQRSRRDPEYELIDTGIFDEDRYFDIIAEYAKDSPEELIIQISIFNRGPEPATLHLLPTLWFRNTWQGQDAGAKPSLSQAKQEGIGAIIARHPRMGARYLRCDRDVPLLFTENETNAERIFGSANATAHVKDGINEYVVHGRTEAVNAQRVGTKAAAHYELVIPPGAAELVRLRLGEEPPATQRKGRKDLFATRIAEQLEIRRKEADEFYDAITPPGVSADARNVMRQALAGMLWSMQYYQYPVRDWLAEAPPDRPHRARAAARNQGWSHFDGADLISVPDKWEYPWLASWDLAFHAIALARVDVDLAKEQLRLITRQRFAHPNGQLPADEWNFSDVNPPVHASAAWQVYLFDKAVRGEGDIEFLASTFHRLLLNFTWWVNREDRSGRSAFEGGFLGLNHIGVLDRSVALPTGGQVEQADGTSWLAVYALDMLTIALELSFHDSAYQDLACKFYEHFVHIAAALRNVGEQRVGMWDDADGFFYDVLRLPDGRALPLKVRSMVGLLPVFASAIFVPEVYARLHSVVDGVRRFNERHPELLAGINPPWEPGTSGRRLLGILNRDRLRRVLAHMLDEAEFLAPYGVRTLSRFHEDRPYVLEVEGTEYRVAYEPAESSTGLFGGNSNWRGPVWMPVNAMLIQGLAKAYAYHGDGFKVECPTGSGKLMTLLEVAHELQRRLVSIFLRDERGRRAVHGGIEKFQTDPHWRDLLLFYEYFHGDNGAGIGASHQTGWTGLVARLIQATTPALPTTSGHLRGYTELLAEQTVDGISTRAEQEAAPAAPTPGKAGKRTRRLTAAVQ